MRWIAGALVGLALLASPVAADDGSGVRAVIAGQMEAFQADDGPGAYAFAAPRIRKVFPNPDIFMSMVKSGYAPVYRPKSVTYGRLQTYAEGFAQEVFLIGPDGKAYTAIYLLERQPDGSLKIAGVRMVEAGGESA